MSLLAKASKPLGVTLAVHFIQTSPLFFFCFVLLLLLFTLDPLVLMKANAKVHITVQLFALSFRKSVATAESSGLLGMCEIRFVALCDLFRLTFLFVLLTHANVAT